MGDDIAQLKQLQAGMNAAFESLFKITKESPQNVREIATAREQILTMAQVTIGTILGPAFTIIGLSCQHIAYSAVRVALDLKLFEIIIKPTSLDELVHKTDADPVILQRILRAVCTIGFLKQTAAKEWEPTPLSHAANVPALRDWLKAHFDQRVVISGQFPEWLKNRGYKSTGSADDCVLSEVLGENAWKFYEHHPDFSAVFDSAMTIQESFPKSMLPRYPFAEDVGELRTGSDAVTLVDIGGGFGQSIRAIRAQYPAVKGRFILQDLPRTISQIDAVQAKEEGILEPMAHDFFTPQPVKGAKYYHLRRVLHDWNDESNIKILEATRVAMKDTSDYSRLLLHETVLPDVGCDYAEAMVDLIMMQTCYGMERTETQWRELLGKAGFQIVKSWKADTGNIVVIEAAIA